MAEQKLYVAIFKLNTLNIVKNLLVLKSHKGDKSWRALSWPLGLMKWANSRVYVPGEHEYSR